MRKRMRKKRRKRQPGGAYLGERVISDRILQGRADLIVQQLEVDQPGKKNLMGTAEGSQCCILRRAKPQSAIREPQPS